MQKAIADEFLEGFRHALPITLVVWFFGMLFGATGVSNGLTFFETLLSSMVVFAGASQFVFLDLYGQQVPVWSVLLAVFAVNFRHLLYSASLGRHMGEFGFVKKYLGFFLLADPVFGAGELRALQGKLRPSYYFGYALPFYPIWIASTAVGGWFGKFIENPQAWGMDMLLSVYFLTLLMGFRSRPNWLTTVLASGVVSVLVYNTIGSPWHITMGSVAGIILAAFIGKPEQSPANQAQKGATKDG
ncbi:MAG: AzlC family ABC transporter permease [Pseudomonadota bacterium]